MIKNSYTRKIVSWSIMIIICIASYSGFVYAQHHNNTNQYDSLNIDYILGFSKPILKDDGEYLDIIIEDSDSFLSYPAGPKVPICTKSFEFPQGTKIAEIKIIPGDIETWSISKKIKPVPALEQIGNSINSVENKPDTEIYNSNKPYPSNWYDINTGAGINQKGEHVLFLSIHLYPTRYYPAADKIQYVEEMQISIKFEEPLDPPVLTGETYDLLIITPSEFSAYLQPLVTHKNSYNMDTNLVTLENIYNIANGRDHAEQIKYFIKYAVEQWQIQYVLLVGDIKKLPIRDTYAYPWRGWGDNLLSDLYYADIYDENFSFCSWDANDNDKFGEISESTSFPPLMTDIDGVDLYPDVNIGRLACTDYKEVQTIVEKIITYEKYTYDQIWFKKIILAGGDTFPPGKGSLPFIYEGEITNKKVAEQLPDFDHVKLWASRRNLNPITFNRAITRGAGFVSYAGHGFEHGWGTYRPNALRNKMGFIQLLYYTPFIRGIKNQNKLPIIFFDACLTAKLDFNISDLENYYPTLIKLLLILTKMPYDPSYYFPCFAWVFLPKEDGGAIATIGATRPAYTWVDKEGVYAGAGYLDVQFFKAYEEGITVSQMLTQAQNNYINNIGKDYFTIEEYLLFGDPSLVVGGYP